MKLYHGTTKDKYEKIKKEGSIGFKGLPTYFSTEKKYALMHGDYLIEIDYEPSIEQFSGNKLTDGTPVVQVIIYGIILIKNRSI